MPLVRSVHHRPIPCPPAPPLSSHLPLLFRSVSSLPKRLTIGSVPSIPSSNHQHLCSSFQTADRPRLSSRGVYLLGRSCLVKLLPGPLAVQPASSRVSASCNSSPFTEFIRTSDTVSPLPGIRYPGTPIARHHRHEYHYQGNRVTTA